jgi:Flp pilus assembly secretin CpaC
LSKLPFIGDIPILGNLFKSRDIQRNRTDLILLVTPEITDPLNPTDPRPEINFPKDFLIKLDQVDLKNATEAAKTNSKTTVKKK